MITKAKTSKKDYRYGAENRCEEIILRSVAVAVRTARRAKYAFSELGSRDIILLIIVLAIFFGGFTIWIVSSSDETVVDPPDGSTEVSSIGDETSETATGVVEESKEDFEANIQSMTSLEEVAEFYQLNISDLRTLCKVSIGEAVGDGERSVLGVMNVIVNAANEWHDGDIEAEVYSESRYSCIEDGEVYCWLGPVTDEVIFREDCRWVIPLAVKVLLKEEPDITCGARYYVAYKRMGYTLDEFLDANHIQGFVILGTQVFFKDWPDTLN